MQVKYNKLIIDYQKRTSVFNMAGIEADIYRAMVETVLEYTPLATPEEKTLTERLTAKKPGDPNKDSNEAYQKLVTDREEEFWAEFNKPTIWNLWFLFSEPKIAYIEGNQWAT